MTEEKKVLSLGAKPKLELKKPVDAGGAPRGAAAGVVQQQFSHGRRNAVVVEAKRERRQDAGAPPKAGAAAPAAGAATGADAKHLTQGERDARIRALRGAALQGERKSSLPPAPPRGEQPAESDEVLEGL